MGYTDASIDASWPVWWSDDAGASISANVELHFSVARKLGLDPKSLLDEGQPTFVWQSQAAKFKQLAVSTHIHRSILSSYGNSIGRVLISACDQSANLASLSAFDLRNQILARQPSVRLQDLISLCWIAGIPVVYLRVFPLSAKRMYAMAVKHEGRFAILLARDANYPAPVAFYVAHELGHIQLGHIAEEGALLDFDNPVRPDGDDDVEECQADEFALALLTGARDFEIGTEARRFTAQQLAVSISQTAEQLRIEPGTLALCFGRATDKWAQTYAALKLIYTASHPVWKVINRTAAEQLAWDRVSSDSSSFIRVAMGIA
jgi:Zn-dependent peptidase ImmA (M78 family)